MHPRDKRELDGAYDSPLIPEHPNRIYVWTPEDLRVCARRVGAIAECLGGTEQADLEEAEQALHSAADQLEIV